MDELITFLHQKTTTALGETLESMAFVAIEEATVDEAENIKQPMLGSNLLILEPELLEMRLDVSRELLYQIGETMYTMEREELNEQLINDLLAEILNTLAGRFMTAIIPPEIDFTLSLPELADADEEECTSEFKFYYIAEELPLTVEIKAAETDNLSSLMNN